MQTTNELNYRPACQAATPAECSNCTASYDCVRARSGRSFAWGSVMIGALLALAVIANAVT